MGGLVHALPACLPACKWWVLPYQTAFDRIACPACLPACSEENAGVLEGTMLELLRSMIEEADDLPQQQLDVLLWRLLPAHRAEHPAGHALAAALLQRTETVVQPHLQKLLTALLLGSRTDSELKDDYHSLFYAVRACRAMHAALFMRWGGPLRVAECTISMQVPSSVQICRGNQPAFPALQLALHCPLPVCLQIHETVPQALLPVMPLLKEELEVEGDKRSAAVDLVARLFTQHPHGSDIIEEYQELFDALLKRACDKEVSSAVWAGMHAGGGWGVCGRGR